MFKAPLEIALQEYFKDQRVSILESLYQSLNAIDTTRIKTPNYLQFCQLTREMAYYNYPNQLNDSWQYKTKIVLYGQELEMIIPYFRSPDEICPVNLRRLVKIVGPSLMRIFNSLILGQRVLIIGYNHSAVDVCNIVLSVVALISPPIPNVIRRTYPYASLSDLTFMDTDGYIAGVTNPMFQEMDSKWDMLCVLDLPNDTSTVMSSDEKRADVASTKRKPVSSRPATQEDASRVTAENPEESSLTSHETLDYRFFTNILAGITINKYGEAWIRAQFWAHVAQILDYAIDAKQTFFDSTNQDAASEAKKNKKKQTIGEKARDILRRRSSSQDQSSSPTSINVSRERSSSSEAGDARESMAEKTQSAFSLSQKSEFTFSANKYRAKILSRSKEIDLMPASIFLWSQYDDLNLWKQIRRLVYEVDIDTTTSLQIFSDIHKCIVACSDAVNAELRCQGLLSMLPVPNTRNNGGLHCIAVGLFHSHAKIRRLTVEILKQLGSFPSTSYLISGLNRMYTIAYTKNLLLLEQGTLLTEEEDAVANDTSMAKRLIEQEKELRDRKEEEQIIVTRSTDHSMSLEDGLVVSIMQPVEALVSNISTGVSALFKVIDDDIELEQQNYVHDI